MTLVASHSPYGVAGIVGDQQRARPVDGHPDRAAMSLAAAVVLKEACQHIEGTPSGRPSLNGTKTTL